MRIVIVGGTGLIGSKLVSRLGAEDHDVQPASPASGVNTVTGEGLAEVLEGTDVVVDVTNSQSFDPDAILSFFETSTKNLLAAEDKAGVRHHVALSVVGTHLLTESGYFRGKIAQENLINASAIPHTVVRATQFFEFVQGIADGATDGTTVRVAPVLIQPMAADDVADAIARVAVGEPANGTVEIGGPEQFRLDALIQTSLTARNDPRSVVTDPEARYFGALLSERTLVPAEGAQLGETRFEDWLNLSLAADAQI